MAVLLCATTGFIHEQARLEVARVDSQGVGIRRQADEQKLQPPVQFLE